MGKWESEKTGKQENRETGKQGNRKTGKQESVRDIEWAEFKSKGDIFFNQSESEFSELKN